jgi:hypothetical protein
MSSIGLVRKTLVVTVLAAAALSAWAAEPTKGLEEAFNAALASKKGVTLYVNGAEIGGAITKLEAGQYVELRSQQYGRIVVRWDRIDGIAMP